MPSTVPFSHPFLSAGLPSILPGSKWEDQVPRPFYLLPCLVVLPPDFLLIRVLPSRQVVLPLDFPQVVGLLAPGQELPQFVIRPVVLPPGFRPVVLPPGFLGNLHPPSKKFSR